MNDLTPTEKAWLAGIIEGEGSFTLTGTGNGTNISVEMTDADVIFNIKWMFGCGSVNEYEREGKKDTHRWISCTAEENIRICEALIPLLSIRREKQARKVLNTAKKAVEWKENGTPGPQGLPRGEVREIYQDPRTYKKIAEDHDIWDSTVGRIKRREVHRHDTEDLVEES